MNFIKTPIQDLFILEPQVFYDARGYFFESYNEKTFKKNGLSYTFIQDNQSKSDYGTIRGLHFQKAEHAQAKLVRVLDGKVLDVVVDLRRNSKTFGEYFSIELSSENNLQLLIPRGFAHGFSVLSKTTIFSYKCDNLYHKESEGGLIYNDKQLDIDWKIEPKKEILSEKDLLHPTLEELIKMNNF